MAEHEILEALNRLQQKIDQHYSQTREVLNFNETCNYIDVSASHLYKLTSKKEIPHYCPQGKKLYFKRSELDAWLLRNKAPVKDEIDQAAADYLIRKGRTKL